MSVPRHRWTIIGAGLLRLALSAPALFPAIVGFGGGIPPQAAWAMAGEERTRPAFFGAAGLVGQTGAGKIDQFASQVQDAEPA